MSESLYDSSDDDSKVQREVEREIEFEKALLEAAVTWENVQDESDPLSRRNPSTKPPPPTESIEDRLEDYFHIQVFLQKNWKLEENMPARGKDKDYDDYLKTLGLEKNRTKASTAWRTFVAKNGVKGRIDLTRPKEKLIEEYERRTSKSNVVKKAIANTMAYSFGGFKDGEKELMSTLLHDDRLQDAALKRVKFLNSIHADCFKSISESNLSVMIDNFERKAQASGNQFNRDCTEDLLEYENGKMTKRKHFVAIVITRFQLILRDAWKSAILDGADEDAIFVDQVSNYHEILEGCKGTVYNISGWMLKIIQKGTNKRELSVLERFAAANKVSVQEAGADEHLVTVVLDDREYKEGALLRPNRGFFDFGLHVEAIYYVNFNRDLACRYSADLSRKIDEVVLKSKALKDQFRSCIPADFTQEEQRIVWKARDRMLVSYGKMRASDFVKALKSASRPNASDSVSTRQWVQMSHEFAKGKVEK